MKADLARVSLVTLFGVAAVLGVILLPGEHPQRRPASTCPLTIAQHEAVCSAINKLRDMAYGENGYPEATKFSEDSNMWPALDRLELYKTVFCCGPFDITTGNFTGLGMALPDEVDKKKKTKKLTSDTMNDICLDKKSFSDDGTKFGDSTGKGACAILAAVLMHEAMHQDDAYGWPWDGTDWGDPGQPSKEEEKKWHAEEAKSYEEEEQLLYSFKDPDLPPSLQPNAAEKKAICDRAKEVNQCMRNHINKIGC